MEVGAARRKTVARCSPLAVRSGLEQVWTVARTVCGTHIPEASAWTVHPCCVRAEGASEDLVAEIVVFPSVPLKPGTSRSGPAIERDAFTSHAACMRSPAFREHGMQVSSGSAEAACKWSGHGPHGPRCAGPQKASILSGQCVPLCALRPPMLSVSSTLFSWLDHLQLFHIPGSGALDYT